MIKNEILLDRDSGEALHSQLFNILKRKIEHGKIKENDFLPSEAELQKIFDVSRITVRRAIADLENEKYVKKLHGKGTKVLPVTKHRDVSKFTSFTEEALALGETPESVILENDRRIVEEKIANKIGIGTTEKHYYIKRLFLINGRLVGVSSSYIFHQDMIPDHDEFIEKKSLYKLMESKGILVSSASETIEAQMPSDILKAELYLGDNIPVIYRNRIGYDSSGNLIEYTNNYFNAERYKYKVNLSR